jgi:putative membrane protein
MQLLTPLLAQAAAPADWHATTLGGALFYMAVFSLAGTLLAILGYKLFDICTPGDLHEEILKNRNLAAAIIGAAIILGVCIVVAAAIMG